MEKQLIDDIKTLLASDTLNDHGNTVMNDILDGLEDGSLTLTEMTYMTRDEARQLMLGNRR